MSEVMFFSHVPVKVPVKDMPQKCSRKGDSRIGYNTLPISCNHQILSSVNHEENSEH